MEWHGGLLRWASVVPLRDSGGGGVGKTDSRTRGEIKSWDNELEHHLPQPSTITYHDRLMPMPQSTAKVYSPDPMLLGRRWDTNIQALVLIVIIVMVVIVITAMVLMTNFAGDSGCAICLRTCSRRECSRIANDSGNMELGLALTWVWHSLGIF